MPNDKPPLTFIYDRHATDHRAPLDLRLDGCRNWAGLNGWELAGIWFDLGDNALTDGHRPQFNGLCGAMETYAGAREVLCLVHTWERLTRTDALPAYQRRVAAAGGYTATCLGDDDRQALTVGHPAARRNLGAGMRRPTENTTGAAPVVPPEVQAPYGQVLDHVADCEACSGLRGCPAGTRLRQAVREAR
ncbi:MULTISPECIES: hypothetical protein [unclassified Streptomyces]|uniref:hypothetical protein n=1 Tax=unclassified Streptomyces TaxID=2593676 RepID=UPI00341B2214